MKENKEVMAQNIRYYMKKKNVNSTDVCIALDIKQSTFSNWINAKIYPRIDKIEKMAHYFNVSKADLVEEKPQSFNTSTEFEIAWLEGGGSDHRLEFTREEKIMMLQYRLADDETKAMIDRLLAYYFKMNKGENNANS